MENIKDNGNIKPQIDFKKIAKAIKRHRKYYYYALPFTLVFTYLMICCVPRYYSCSVVLAPESDDITSSGGLSSAMSSLGLSGLGKLGNNDAISPDLYPDLLSSNDFLVKMFPITVATRKGDVSTNYYDYLDKHTKHSWWEKIIGKISELIKPTPKSDFRGKGKVDVLHMDKKQQDIAGLIRKNISCEIDQKTYAITVTVKDQDPCVCAIIADSTKQHLQDFIIEYRTSKARNDFAYYNKLYSEAKQNYDKARRKYASFSDANMDVTMTSVRSVIEDLENEMQLKYNIYSTMNTQRQTALAKIQENTPAFTTLQSATIPIKPAGPKRMIISLAMVVVVFVGMSLYFLRKEIC